MWLLLLPDSYPFGFLLLGLSWSGYQSFVGGVAGGYICDRARVDPPLAVGAGVRFFAYVLPHGALYFVCSVAGFLAWRAISTLTLHVTDWSQVGGGAGAVLIALGSIAVSGVGGALPRILYLGGRA